MANPIGVISAPPSQQPRQGLVRRFFRTLGPGVITGAADDDPPALRADAVESITCGYLSIVLMVGLAATRLFGWWWLDSVAALALIPFLIKEAREAINGGCDCCHEVK